MAIINPSAAGPWVCGYYHVRNIAADKGSSTTKVNLGGYADASDRDARYPDAREGRWVSVSGYDLPLSDIYSAILALPEWSGWVSDEPTGV